ncbi:MAG: hypothetical protein ABI614_12580, partial [Planctomycetota bacterium]
MATSSESSPLEQSALTDSEGGAKACTAVAASTPNHQPVKPANAAADPKLSALLVKINTMKKGDVTAAPATKTHAADGTCGDGFVPLEPKSYVTAGLSESDVEGLIFKLLLGRGDTAGRAIADHIRLPFMLVDETLQRLKNDQLL